MCARLRVRNANGDYTQILDMKGIFKSTFTFMTHDTPIKKILDFLDHF